MGLAPLQLSGSGFGAVGFGENEVTAQQMLLPQTLNPKPSTQGAVSIRGKLIR